MLDSPQQAPFFLLRCNSGKSKCHASQGHLCSHPAWTPLVPNTSTIHSWYPVWHQRHLVSRLCHHPSSQIHLCSPALCAHCVCKSIPCDEVAVRIAHDIGISFCRLSGKRQKGLQLYCQQVGQQPRVLPVQGAATAGAVSSATLIRKCETAEENQGAWY